MGGVLTTGDGVSVVSGEVGVISKLRTGGVLSAVLGRVAAGSVTGAVLSVINGVVVGSGLGAVTGVAGSTGLGVVTGVAGDAGLGAVTDAVGVGDGGALVVALFTGVVTEADSFGATAGCTGAAVIGVS